MAALSKKSSERRKQGLFVVEGQRELMHCVQHGLIIHSLFLCDEIANNVKTAKWESLTDKENVFHVTPEVYDKMAYRSGTEGVVAVIHTPDNSLSSLNLSENPLLIVIEGVEKPGNIGAILRSADAAHADAVLICDPLTDLYNPNLIRASIGAVFTVPCAVTDSADCIRFLKEHNIQILTAQLQDSELYYDSDMTSPTAIVMGTEATGLTNQWREAADSHIRIPMLGSLDSLNVSVSTAILLFEAVRQRQQH